MYSNQSLQKVTTGPYFCDISNSTSMWNTHFAYVSKKVSSNLWLLSKVRHYVSTEHRLSFYNAYIKPHFDYCCIIWGNSTNDNMNKKMSFNDAHVK